MTFFCRTREVLLSNIFNVLITKNYLLTLVPPASAFPAAPLKAKPDTKISQLSLIRLRIQVSLIKSKIRLKWFRFIILLDNVIGMLSQSRGAMISLFLKFSGWFLDLNTRFFWTFTWTRFFDNLFTRYFGMFRSSCPCSYRPKIRKLTRLPTIAKLKVILHVSHRVYNFILGVILL